MINKMDGKFRVFLPYKEADETKELIIVFADSPRTNTCKARRERLEKIMKDSGLIGIKRWVNNQILAKIEK